MDVKNLALGKEVKIKSLVPMENSYASVEKGSKDMLTDGNKGDPSSCYSGEWAHFYRGMGRSLTVDLGGDYAVSGFSAGFIHDKNMGIYSPEDVRLLLSENGNDFYCVTTVKSPYPASFDMQVRAVYSENLGHPIKARFARIDFGVEVNVFCDEFSVFGRECDGAEAELYGEPVREVNKNCFAARDSMGGAYDIPLLYFGYWPEDERVAKLRKSDFIPYVAYIDRDGNPIDTMFDSILMLTVQGRCPSGGCLGYHGAPSKLSDWEFVIEELFAEGQNLKALDEAVAELKPKIGLAPDYKHKVYLTAPVPKVSNEPFGDLNGDGIEEKLLTDDDCIEAYAAFVDMVTRRFESEHLQNIVIDGWFWNNESASRANRDEEEYFATRCVENLHKRGYKCVFIPYFQAGGSEKAESIGFDCTTMQPGLSFQQVLGKDPQAMMQDFTDLCKKYGFGVELEVHHGVKNPETRETYSRLFDEYMLACMRNGMMTDTVHTYYQAAGPGVFYSCAVSKEDSMRVLYEKLYKFIKGTLTEDDFTAKPKPEECEEVSFAEVPDAIETLEEISETPYEVTAEIVEPVTDISETEELDGLNPLAVERDEVLLETEIFEEGEAYEETKCEKAKRFIKKNKKKIALGVGIATALGTAYIIAKAIKGKD